MLAYITPLDRVHDYPDGSLNLFLPIDVVDEIAVRFEQVNQVENDVFIFFQDVENKHGVAGADLIFTDPFDLVLPDDFDLF